MTSRLASVDALRGCAVAAMLLVNNPGDWGHVYEPLEHAAWHGWTPTDLIFPLFLFIVGVSLSLGMGARIERGAGAPLRAALWKRSLRIVLLGLALHGLAWWWLDLPALRWPGVLQRIGLCLALTGAVVLHWRERGQWVWWVLLLVGYGAWLLSGGTLAPGVNVASRLDAWLLGAHAYQWDPATGVGHDPEGLLSTLGAWATTLLGWLAGEALRKGRRRGLAVMAVVMAAAGWMLDASGVMPINKQLWTSAFVLWTGGVSTFTLLVAHVLVDQRGWPAWGRRFGVNAIAAYAGAWIMSIALAASGWMPVIYGQGFGAVAGWMGPPGQSLAFACAFVAIWWGVAVALDKRGIHIKV